MSLLEEYIAREADELEKRGVRVRVLGDLERLTPPRRLTLEESLEFARDDECVEVTPATVRVRKVELDQTVRGRARNRKPKL